MQKYSKRKIPRRRAALGGNKGERRGFGRIRETAIVDANPPL
jgi:hypothetical protein